MRDLLKSLREKIGELDFQALDDMLAMQNGAVLFTTDGKRNTWGKKNYIDCLETRIEKLINEREQTMTDALLKYTKENYPDSSQAELFDQLEGGVSIEPGRLLP